MTNWSAERHEAAKARCEAATWGPWEVEHNEYEPNEEGLNLWESSEYSPFNRHEYTVCTGWNHPQAHGPIRIISIGYSGYFEGPETTLHMDPEDAEFVAHARTDLPDALAEIERLQEIVHELKQSQPSDEEYEQLYSPFGPLPFGGDPS